MRKTNYFGSLLLRKELDSLGSVYERMGLAVPENDFYEDSNNLPILFMHHAGCVVRVSKQHAIPLLRHELLARPIGSILLDGKLRLDFQYAGNCNVTFDETKKITEKLKEDGIYSVDISTREENCLRLPAAQFNFPNGVPVAFDTLRLEKLDKTVRNISRKLNCDQRVIDFQPTEKEEPDLQDVMFADLRQKFANCFVWNDDRDDPAPMTNPEKVRDFWASMIKARQEEPLIPSWMPEYSEGKITNHVQLYRIDTISKNYHEHLKRKSPIFAELLAEEPQAA